MTQRPSAPDRLLQAHRDAREQVTSDRIIQRDVMPNARSSGTRAMRGGGSSNYRGVETCCAESNDFPNQPATVGPASRTGRGVVDHMTGIILFIFTTLISDAARSDDSFEQRRDRRMEACIDIPEDEYSTGLLFNPPGYKTFFHRAECLQKLAIDEHDPELCRHVHERKSWLFDGSAISPDACRVRVSEELEDDQKNLEQFLQVDPYRITSIVLRKNGNGKDYDLLLDTEGLYSGSYVFSLSARSRSKTVVLLDTSYRLGPKTGTLHLFLRAADLERKLGTGWMTKAWRMRGELALMRDAQNRFWYDRIPRNVAADVSEFPIVFDELAPWSPEPVGR